jgi:hypothetical protein
VGVFHHRPRLRGDRSPDADSPDVRHQ